ncbi:DUF421 domain-containing protein [Hymenobacter gummosus]|uniref:DUF421 domain-containing protein n=1 Tax=Hymenobacter gummosus TaxID=1776032 RepID=A0A3S0J8G7_9BACT|nr:YetF domain-containing protein [Hymenobacter gummosus]RTQ47884.1 DUF421 domain-containing protein [Hymenobacter gummosus]
MKPEDIHLTDYMRIILGQVPWSFVLEAVLRMVFLYLLLIVSMRLMGKRMAGMLSRIEMAGMVTLAAAIGVPLLAPDRGLLPAVIIAAVAVLIQRLIARLGVDHKELEQATQGDIGIVVADGRLHYPDMEKAVLSKERLFAELRFSGIDNLGKIKRAYMEANGSFTILKATEPKPGLTLIPSWDEDFLNAQPKAPDTYACCHCGFVRRSVGHEPNTRCDACGHKEWTPAVLCEEE